MFYAQLRGIQNIRKVDLSHKVFIQKLLKFFFVVVRNRKTCFFVVDYSEALYRTCFFEINNVGSMNSNIFLQPFEVKTVVQICAYQFIFQLNKQKIVVAFQSFRNVLCILNQFELKRSLFLFFCFFPDFIHFGQTHVV